MPEEIELADGTRREVPTEEELKNLQAGHDANKGKKPVLEEFNKLKETLEIKEGESLEDKLKDMKEAANPNWQKTRETIKSLKIALKEKGVEIDGDDNIVENKQGLTTEQIQEIVDKQVETRLTNKQFDTVLSKYSEEERKSADPMLKKLMSLGGSLEENMGIVDAKLFPERKSDPARDVYNNTHTGNGPLRANPDTEDFSKTEGGKMLAQNMGLQFAQEDPNKKKE